MRVDLEKVRQKLVCQLKEDIERIQVAEMPDIIDSITLTAVQVRDEQEVKNIANYLPEKGCYIYWFETSNPDSLLSSFKDRQKQLVDYKVARDNKGTDSKYVYVGSCTKTKLKDRFKQHCGWGNINTYSLQLNHWLNADLNLTFSYVKIEDAIVASQLEDQLHKELKPLFGKPGANNKITKN